MFRNKTAVASSVFGSFPRPPEVVAGSSRQDEIPRAGRSKELQQLAWRVRHVGFPRSGQHFTIIDVYVPAQTERIAILGFVAD